MRLDIRVDERGIADELKRLSPQQMYTVWTRFFNEGPNYVKEQLRARAPQIVRSRVKVKRDPMQPPQWALVGSTHPLAHFFEGGTGALGDPEFKHRGRFFPNVTGRFGVQEATGLPKAQAFLIARRIYQQGGVAPRPYVKPTMDAVRGQVLAIARRIVDEVLK